MAEEFVSEAEELERLRKKLWEHLDGIEPGGQTLGIGAISGQLVKITKRLDEIGETEKGESLADILGAGGSDTGNVSALPKRRGSRRAG